MQSILLPNERRIGSVILNWDWYRWLFGVCFAAKYCRYIGWTVNIGPLCIMQEITPEMTGASK